jgi:hypothetical protein
MLKIRNKLENNILLIIIYIYNIIFIKYKPLFTYLLILYKILISANKVLIYFIFKKKIKEYFKKLRNYF